MKKRIEKVVECIKDTAFITIGKKYLVHSESKEFYSVMDDEGDVNCWEKGYFKVVSVKEVLEFEGLFADNGYLEKAYNVTIKSEIDLTNYDIKVTATPKDISFKTYEEMSKEELIELLKAKE